MLKNHEDRGEVGMYSFFSLSTMDEASRKLFAKAYAQSKARKNNSNDSKDHKNNDSKVQHHKKVTLNK